MYVSVCVCGGKGELHTVYMFSKHVWAGFWCVCVYIHVCIYMMGGEH